VIAKEEQLKNVDLHQPMDLPNAETHLLQIATKDVHLLTHVIAKLEQLKNADLPQPMDLLNAEMHSLQIATKDAPL
jgi:hypothetical protein